MQAKKFCMKEEAKGTKANAFLPQLSKTANSQLCCLAWHGSGYASLA